MLFDPVFQKNTYVRSRLKIEPMSEISTTTNEKPRPENYKQRHKLVAAWIPIGDFEFLRGRAQAHNISVSAYIRAILVDAMEDETQAIAKSTRV